MKPTGSDYDVAVLLAKDLGVALEVVPTVGATRIPNLQTGKADIIISRLRSAGQPSNFICPTAWLQRAMTSGLAPCALALRSGKARAVVRSAVVIR